MNANPFADNKTRRGSRLDMKKAVKIRAKLTVLMFFLLVSSIPTFAQRSGFGQGIILGEPVGFISKMWLGPSNAAAVTIAPKFEGDNPHFTLHIDYLWHDFSLIGNKSDLPVYFGIGGTWRLTKDENQYGARFPVGLNYLFARVPMDLFVEVAPIVNLAPRPHFRLNAGIGTRFFFGSRRRTP